MTTPGSGEGPQDREANEPLNLLAIEREEVEPTEQRWRAPAFVAFVTGAVCAWGMFYFYAYADLGGEQILGDARTVATAATATEKAPAAPSSAPATAEPRGPDGSAVYASICAACHQATGAGLPPVFPPLAGSQWVAGDPRRLAALVIQGLSGPIEVLGQRYEGAMPPFGAQLDDAEIAAALSYVRSAWGNRAEPVTPALVAEVRAELAGRTEALAGGAELRRLFP